MSILAEEADREGRFGKMLMDSMPSNHIGEINHDLADIFID